MVYYINAKEGSIYCCAVMKEENQDSPGLGGAHITLLTSTMLLKKSSL